MGESVGSRLVGRPRKSLKKKKKDLSDRRARRMVHDRSDKRGFGGRNAWGTPRETNPSP